MRSLLRRSLVLALLALVSDSTAIRVNVTIDDEDGDASTGWKPQYFPSSAWAQGSKCSGCAITGLADSSQAFDETWHDSTYHPEQPQRVVQINFNGSAVYVYNLVANTIPGVTTFTNLTFVLDGTEVGQYTHSPQNNAASTFLYRTVVYQNDGLAQAPHTLSIEAGGPTDSLVLFDYVIYTTEQDATGVPSSSLTPSTTFGTQAVMPEATSTPPVGGSQSASAKSSSVAVGAGIGAAVGVVLALLTLVIGTLVFRKRRSLALLLFSRKGTNVHHNTNRPSSFDGAEDTWPRSSPVSSSYPSPLHPPSPIVSSLYPTIETSSSFRSSDLVFAPIPTPSPRNSASRIPTPLATPPDHRADVPAPAISATGTEHSVRLADLTREIAELEQLMRGIHKGEGKRKPRGPRDGLGHGVDISFGALQERVARLREELEAERRLLIEALPREKRHDPWSLKGRKLRVVNPEESSNA